MTKNVRSGRWGGLGEPDGSSVSLMYFHEDQEVEGYMGGGRFERFELYTQYGQQWTDEMMDCEIQ